MAGQYRDDSRYIVSITSEMHSSHIQTTLVYYPIAMSRTPRIEYDVRANGSLSIGKLNHSHQAKVMDATSSV